MYFCVSVCAYVHLFVYMWEYRDYYKILVLGHLGGSICMNLYYNIHFWVVGEESQSIPSSPLGSYIFWYQPLSTTSSIAEVFLDSKLHWLSVQKCRKVSDWRCSDLFYGRWSLFEIMSQLCSFPKRLIVYCNIIMSVS